MKKRLALLLTLIMTFTLFVPMFDIDASAMNFAKELNIKSAAVYMENIETGEVVFDKDSSVQRVPASLTKIMTCLLILEKFDGNVEKMKNEKISGDADAFDELADTGCSTADIKRGERVSYYDLLHALMIPSACEAANILAINSEGSIEKFVEKMNAKASLLGMRNTHYSNAHGLFSENNYSTCEDIAILCKYIMNKYPLFMEICNKPNYQMEATKEHPNGSIIVNTNELIVESTNNYYRYASGIKTGFLDTAGRCLVSTASKDGYSYIIVSMGAPGYDESGASTMFNCIDHKNLYVWAFNNLSYTTLLNQSTEVGDVKVEYGQDYDYVNVRPQDEYACLWPKDIPASDIKKKITLTESVVAPVTAGDVLGSIQLTYSGQVITTVNLVATNTVERAEAKSDVKVAKHFTDSKYFKFAIIAVIAIIVLYLFVFMMFIYIRKKRENAEYDDDDEIDE